MNVGPMQIEQLSISVNGNSIVHDFSLLLRPGSTHVLMGPNGSGKSSLVYAIAGHPSYIICHGQVIYNTIDLLTLSPHERAQHGIFLAFQQPIVVPGVRTLTFLKEAHRTMTGQNIEVDDFYQICCGYMRDLRLDPSLLHRDVNEGFSGGERKRFELLQALILKPKILILDEIDAGLDVDALAAVGTCLDRLRCEQKDLVLLIITHYPRLLQFINPDSVHVMNAGRLVKTGNVALAHEIEQKGYDAYTASAS